jgi:hypothetical protein
MNVSNLLLFLLFQHLLRLRADLHMLLARLSTPRRARWPASRNTTISYFFIFAIFHFRTVSVLHNISSVSFFSQSSGNFVPPLESSCRFPLLIQRRAFVPQSLGDNLLTEFSSDPSILHPPYAVRPSSAAQSNEASAYPPPPQYPASPSFSQMSRSPRPVKQGSQSPYPSSYGSSYPYPPPRRPSLASHQSYGSENGNFSSEESKEKGRCTYPECGKLFKDLKAHMLTHQNERPEKCPIQTCDYHIKGFARKYDKNRHTSLITRAPWCAVSAQAPDLQQKSLSTAQMSSRDI